MFPEVANLLSVDWSRGELISISEQSPAEASFVLCHLLSSALRSGAAVRVLALDKPPSHYRHLAAKCGANVRQAESAGTLTFVDGAEMALESLRAGAGPLAPGDGGRLALEPLYRRLTAPGLLLVDGLAALVALGASVPETLLLVASLRRWAARRGALLAVLTAEDPADPELARLAAAADRLADLAVSVRALQSGHCPEVTGELSVRRRGRPELRRQFKAEDRNVRVFAAGTSRAVL